MLGGWPTFAAAGPPLRILLRWEHRGQMSQLFFACASSLAKCPTIPGVTTARMNCISSLAALIIANPWLASPQRRDLFLAVLEEVRQRYRFVVVGYVAMPDHIHLLISEPEKGDPSRVMQAIKQGFSRRVLKSLRTPSCRTARIICGRFRTCVAAALLRFQRVDGAQADRRNFATCTAIP